MSFRDLDGSRGGHASRAQPKQRRDEDSPFERSIKANIQEMQESVRMASEQLERAQRSFLSKRMGEILDKYLEKSHELAQQTETLFRDWTLHLADEPSERHRKKFSFEKLQKTFEEEVAHLKDVARKVMAAQQETSGACNKLGPSKVLECHSVCEDQGVIDAEIDEEQGLLNDQDSPQHANRMAMEEDTMMQGRIAQEREEGIRRIRNQVSEVNQIFRDLASLVGEQGQQLETIEQQAEVASCNSKQTVRELKKAVDRQRSSREQLCCLLTIAILVLCLVLVPHMHIFGGDHATAISQGGSIGSSDTVSMRSGQPLQTSIATSLPSALPPAVTSLDTLEEDTSSEDSGANSMSSWGFQTSGKVITKTGHAVT